MYQDDPEKAGEAVLEVIDNQINDNNPPQVKEAFDRLRKLGISRRESKKYIACAFSVELFDVMREGKEMDYDRYFANLKNLPEMPWEDE
ncbi:hypothetical protein [Candidatus Colwellia aromaticivorans]|uniref:hypothetical protein n=1 Tax=Candidatus Colwellia aromaticivorans TaxID=2267621 RepID=UPI000DF13B54|nr:hypothetical protein [Candidatus Colwellia aromaticivorans]